MDAKRKKELITRNLQEVLEEKQLDEILSKRDLKVYWGTAPTGRIHIGYMIPFAKIADLLESGAEVKILIADLHAYLDSSKTPFELLEHRFKYYKLVVSETLKAMGVNIDKLDFVKGTDYQLSKDYILDVYKMASITTVSEGVKAGAEVVKQADNPRLAPVLYPLLQAIDEEYLEVDAQFGGVDQRKIFVLAHEFLPKLRYKKRIHLMNPMLPGLTGSKMSASDENSKIDLIDTEKKIKKKINKSYCPEKEVEDNGVLTFAKLVLFPYLERQSNKFVIERPERFGGNISFDSYNSLEDAYVKGELHPADLKSGVANYIIEILEPVREIFEKEENKKILELAYK